MCWIELLIVNVDGTSKSHAGKIRLSKAVLCALLYFFFPSHLVADECKPDPDTEKSLSSPKHETGEKHRHGYTFHFEQDAFTFFDGKNQDRDYTQGTSVEWYGRRINDAPFFNVPLNFIDRLVDCQTGLKFKDDIADSITLGIKAYTPERLDDTDPIQNDHPFASYVFITDSKTREIEGSSQQKRRYWRTAFTLGTLGNDIAKNFQNMVHQINEAPERNIPKGWKNQIEQNLVFNYQFTYLNNRYKELDGPLSSEFGYFLGGNIGTIFLDAFTGVSGRVGIFTNEYISLPGLDQTKNIEFYPTLKPTETPENKKCTLMWPDAYECYVYASLSLKGVASNRLIEGYPGNKARCSACELEPVVGFLSFGLTFRFTRHFTFSLAQHIRTNEFTSDLPDSGRDHYYGGIYFAVDNPF